MIVRHRNGSYEVCPSTLPDSLESLPDDVRIITDSNVAALLPALDEAKTLVLPPGETSKTLETFSRCLSWLAQTRASRRTCLVALGGGVIGDLVGFVASSYMRGIPFVQMPTTLLAMVDSSVGGKVGVDLPEGKNLAGAFYPPSRVDLCLDLLPNLPAKQFRNGMAEVVKYGLIMDADLLSKGRTLEEIVLRCVELKAQVVEEDEFETTGRRAILNFGHTIGHAVEHAMLPELLHGEAIAIGMTAEARLGERLGISPPGTEIETVRQLSEKGLPTEHPILREADRLVSLMKGDKKATGDSLAFSLLTKIGACKLVKDVPESVVRSVLTER